MTLMNKIYSIFLVGSLTVGTSLQAMEESEVSSHIPKLMKMISLEEKSISFRMSVERGEITFEVNPQDIDANDFFNLGYKIVDFLEYCDFVEKGDRYAALKRPPSSRSLEQYIQDIAPANSHLFLCQIAESCFLKSFEKAHPYAAIALRHIYKGEDQQQLLKDILLKSILGKKEGQRAVNGWNADTELYLDLLEMKPWKGCFHKEIEEVEALNPGYAALRCFYILDEKENNPDVEQKKKFALEVIERHKYIPAVSYPLAIRYMGEGKYEEALDVIRHLFELNPTENDCSIFLNQTFILDFLRRHLKEAELPFDIKLKFAEYMYAADKANPKLPLKVLFTSALRLLRLIFNTPESITVSPYRSGLIATCHEMAEKLPQGGPIRKFASLMEELVLEKYQVENLLELPADKVYQEIYPLAKLYLEAVKKGDIQSTEAITTRPYLFEILGGYEEIVNELASTESPLGFCALYKVPEDPVFALCAYNLMDREDLYSNRLLSVYKPGIRDYYQVLMAGSEHLYPLDRNITMWREKIRSDVRGIQSKDYIVCDMRSMIEDMEELKKAREELHKLFVKKYKKISSLEPDELFKIAQRSWLAYSVTRYADSKTLFFISPDILLNNYLKCSFAALESGYVEAAKDLLRRLTDSKSELIFSQFKADVYKNIYPEPDYMPKKLEDALTLYIEKTADNPDVSFEEKENLLSFFKDISKLLNGYIWPIHKKGNFYM